MDLILEQGISMSWQYNGVAPWNDIVSWCNTMIPNDVWSNGCETLSFDNEAAYVWFLLRWR